MIMNKKGVSPLIAWVLLIGLSIAIGVAVITWAIDVIPEPEADIAYCDDVSLSFVDYEFVDDGTEFQDIEFHLINTGYFSIDMMSFGFSYFEDVPPESWCDLLVQTTPEGDSFEPNEDTRYDLNDPGDDDPFVVSLVPFNPDCGNANGDYLQNYEGVRSVTIVPWINVDGATLNCNDRKIEFAVEYDHLFEQI